MFRGRLAASNTARFTGNIFFLLQSHNRRSHLGRVLTNETGIVVKRDPDTVRGADVLFISHGRLPAADKWKGFLHHAPELVVEVFSREDSWKNMERKVADYHAAGVDMVWVADPQTLSLRLYPKGAGSSVLHAADEVTGGDFLPGFRCKVSDFFAT